MLILAIETSGPLGSVALFEGSALLAEQSLELGKKHAQSLIPTISQILQSAGRPPSELQLVAVSIGPGSYTGLRVGVVAAKLFAFAVGFPLVAVDTLHAIAVNAPDDVRQVDVIADAQRGDLFVGRYERNGANAWIRCGDVNVERAETWLDDLTANRIVSGPGLEKLTEQVAGRCRTLPPETWIPRAAVIARLGADLFESGTTVDIAAIEPLYLRRSSAEVQWEKLHPRT